MSFKVNDKEWRDTVRRFFFHLWGESLKNIPEDIEGTFHDGDGIEHPFQGKAELIEIRVNNTFKNGFADALKLFYEEHGCYPPLPDLSKPRLVREEGPRAIWSGAMSEDVTAKFREYANQHVNLHETEMTKVLETPGRSKMCLSVLP